MIPYSPLMELYRKHQKWVHDFLFQLGLIILVVFADTGVFYGFRQNLPTLSLSLFVTGYLGARFVIRAKGKQALFGSFANEGPLYCTLLAVGLWAAYMFLIRSVRIR